MPNWSEILAEVAAAKNDCDQVRKKYLVALHALTGRNVIAYYSGWLQKPDIKNPRVLSISRFSGEIV